MARIINAAIVGCGGIHHVHASVIRNIEGVHLAAVCDNKPERAQASAKENDCLCFAEYREMLKRPEIDAVHICTPHYLHASIAIDALRAGKFVIVEKPMACSDAEAQAMISEDEKQGMNRLCVIFQNRYNDSVRALKDIIDGGQYGALKCMRGSVVWQRTPEYYSDDWHGKKALECGGVMINQAIHTLDLVQWLCGGAKSIKGSVSTDALTGIIEVEDSAHMHILMKSGIPAVFYATVAYGAHSPPEIEAVMERGTFLFRENALYRTDEAFEMICNSAFKPLLGKDYWGNGHLAQISDFYRCVRENRPFFIDGTQGAEAIKLVCGLYESSEKNKVVAL